MQPRWIESQGSNPALEKIKKKWKQKVEISVRLTIMDSCVVSGWRKTRLQHPEMHGCCLNNIRELTLKSDSSMAAAKSIRR